MCSYSPDNCATHNVLLYKITANKIYVAILYVDVNLNDSAVDAGGDEWCCGGSWLHRRRPDAPTIEWSAALFLSNLLQHFVAAFMLLNVLHALDFDMVVIFILFLWFISLNCRSLLATDIRLGCSIIISYTNFGTCRFQIVYSFRTQFNCSLLRSIVKKKKEN